MGSARDTRMKTREISSVKFLTKNIIIISHCHLSCFYSNDIAFCQAQWKRVHRVTEISGFTRKEYINYNMDFVKSHLEKMKL